MYLRQIEKLRVEKAKKIKSALGCPYDEAYQLVLDDEEVDKMTSLKQIEEGLTDEQKKVSKEMRSTTSGKKQTRKPRSKVIDINKREIYTLLEKTLRDEETSPTLLTGLKGISVVSTTQDKEIVISYGAKEYKVTISTPRTKKEEA